MRRVRENSIAHKVVRVCNFIDNTMIGSVIAGITFSAVFGFLAVYGLHCTHPFF